MAANARQNLDTMEFMKHPCKHCPFRSDVKPFLHPDRAAELAYGASNPYQQFPCHKTTEYDEDSEDGNMLQVEASKECAGFLTLRAQAGMDVPKGFKPAWEICYIDDWDMIESYENEWSEKNLIKQN